MRGMLGVAVTICCTAGSANAIQICTNDNIGNGSIGVFADAAGTSNCLVAPPLVSTTWYVVARLEGESSTGMSGAEFRIEIANPTGYFFNWAPNPNANFATGSPINSTPPTPALQFGTDMGFSTCQTPSDGKVLLGTIQAINFGAQGPTTVSIMAKKPPLRPYTDCPFFFGCEPAPSRILLTTSADVLGREGVISRSLINQPGCLPCDPAGLQIGIFASEAGIPTNPLCAQRNTLTVLPILGRVPDFAPPGVAGVQFRIEVSNPAGYLFSYTAPNGAQAIGSPLNILGDNTNGPAGVTVLFPSCTAGDSMQGNLVDLGSLSVLDFAGAPCQVSIRAANSPGSGSPSCARWFRCDAPLNTPVCVLPTSPGGAAFEVGLNTEGCTQAPFTQETLQLDTHEAANDGAAGPVTTTQALYEQRTFLVTVEGTASLTNAVSWNAPPAVLCGTPEQAPQIASPGVTNYWVGADPEIQFATPLPAGSDCADLAALGYPRHHARLQVDFGNGFEHVEPLGPVPADPAPGHQYQYLVTGTGAPAQFRWVEPQTSDNYGVLRITIDDVSPTDALPSVLAPTALSARSVTVLPNSPDPFNPATEVRWWLAAPTVCTVAVFDARGSLVRRLLDGPATAGFHSVRWDGRCDNGARAATGVYFARVSSEFESASERMVLVK